MPSTRHGKYEDLAMGPFSIAWDTHGGPLLTASWRPYVKNFAPNATLDYGSRVAALSLDRA
jgi:hypothetical protein